MFLKSKVTKIRVVQQGIKSAMHPMYMIINRLPPRGNIPSMISKMRIKKLIHN